MLNESGIMDTSFSLIFLARDVALCISTLLLTGGSSLHVLGNLFRGLIKPTISHWNTTSVTRSIKSREHCNKFRENAWIGEANELMILFRVLQYFNAIETTFNLQLRLRFLFHIVSLLIDKNVLLFRYKQ